MTEQRILRHFISLYDIKLIIEIPTFYQRRNRNTVIQLIADYAVSLDVGSYNGAVIKFDKVIPLIEESKCFSNKIIHVAT